LGRLKRFPAKWKPVRIKETRQIKNLEPGSDSIGTQVALGTEYAKVERIARGPLLKFSA
jgi:hypothetical protein